MNYMKLIFKQKMFSWFDSYNVFDEHRNKVFEVKGKLAWGHCQKIYDSHGDEVGMVKEKIVSITPQFNIYKRGKKIGQIKRKIFHLLGPGYDINFLGWKVNGNIIEWNYTIKDSHNDVVATISKELFNLTDTYVLNIRKPEDALYVLMFAIAMDAEKDSRKNNVDD